MLVCRLYSWGREYGEAVKAYREYLGQYPGDQGARLELADIMLWTAKYDPAETEHQAVLREDPKNLKALVGLAQVADQRGDDPFRVQNSFRQVLGVDPSNEAARTRLAEIHSFTAPTITYAHNSFADSDGLFRSVQTAEVSFALPRRIRLKPYYTLGYFHQLRLIAGATPEIEGLNHEIGSRNGTILAQGAGARFEISSHSRWWAVGELGTFHFDSDRSSAIGRLEVSYRGSRNRVLGLSYLHRDAIYDLNTVASLAAGIIGDTLLLSCQQPLGEKCAFGPRAEPPGTYPATSRSSLAIRSGDFRPA